MKQRFFLLKSRFFGVWQVKGLNNRDFICIIRLLKKDTRESGDLEMKEFQYTIRDRMGLHAQPAGFLVKTTMSFPCKITIIRGAKQADAKKILAVVGLGVKCGQEIIVTADGEQEEEAIKTLKEFFEKNL